MSKGKKKDFSITKIDISWILIVVLIYGVLSFINLGTFDNPQTFWKAKESGDYATIKLKDITEISYMRYFTGVKPGDYKLYISNDGEDYTYIGELNDGKAFAWKDKVIDEAVKYLSIIAEDKLGAIGEVSLYDLDGKSVPVTDENETAKLIIDETEVIPKKISYLNSTYFDEIYHARTAYEYVHGLDIYEWTHPPLGKLIMGIPIKIGGMNTFNYRLMGNIAGLLMIVIIFILAKKMFGHTEYALLAAVLLAADGMHFVQTRIATVDSFLVLFIMLAYLFMYMYITCPNNKMLLCKLGLLCLSGLFMGAGIATKWSGAYAGVGLAILFFIDVFKKSKDKYHNHIWEQQRTVIIMSCFIFFGIIPIMVYLASYIPFFRMGEGQSLKAFYDLQLKMYHYHADLVATHPYTSPWYLWPFNIKPVWYYKGEAPEGYISSIVAMGNPIIWWSGIVAILYKIGEAIRRHKKQDLFIVIAILSLYLPYALIPRIMFLYHYFPVVPFMILALTSLLKEIAENMRKIGIVKWYGTIAIISFIFFYPVYSGTYIPLWYAVFTRWLPAWQYF